MTTNTVDGATPILDRQSPLPPRAKPGSGLASVLMAWLVALGIVAICLILDRAGILGHWILFNVQHWIMDEWTRSGLVGFVVSMLCGYYAMIAIHELGHVLAGLCVGFRFRSIRVGPVLFSRPFRISLYRGPGALTNGIVELGPPTEDDVAWRGVVMVLGGPAANFLSALVVLLLPYSLTFGAVFFVTVSLVNAFSDLIPFESRLGVSDGRRIWMLLREQKHGERWLALMKLAQDVNDGVLPESLSAGLLAKAIAVEDDSADTVTAHGFGFWVAFHQHNDDEAGRRLEICLTRASRAAPLLREALMSDAAVFQARRRRRADLAEQWLADMPAKTQIPWFRTRVEAAILEARGDVEGARRKLEEVETAILTQPMNPGRNVFVKLLGRWKAELMQ